MRKVIALLLLVSGGLLGACTTLNGQTTGLDTPIMENEDVQGSVQDDLGLQEPSEDTLTNDSTVDTQTEASNGNTSDQSSTSTTTNTKNYSSQIQTLKTKVETAVKQANALKASNNWDADFQTGYDMLAQLDLLESEVDMLEDEIKWQAQTGNGDYWNQLEQVKQLEFQLDQAKNYIEFEFKIDD